MYVCMTLLKYRVTYVENSSLYVRNADLPHEVDNYHELVPLEPLPTHKAQLLGYPTSTYKATNIKTGVRYCLRRVHGAIYHIFYINKDTHRDSAIQRSVHASVNVKSHTISNRMKDSHET